MPITRATRNRGRVRKDSKTRPGSKKIRVSVAARDNSCAGGSGCGLNGGGGGGGTKSGSLMNVILLWVRERLERLRSRSKENWIARHVAEYERLQRWVSAVPDFSFTGASA